jgi:hypothetical protein
MGEESGERAAGFKHKCASGGDLPGGAGGIDWCRDPTDGSLGGSNAETFMVRDKMQRQRFELKYRLTEELAWQVREFVASYLELDENGVGKPDYSYSVHSLYLDSDQLFTYWATVNGERNRFKLRLRFYNEDPSTPVFFEIKRRVDNVILKQRGGVHKPAVPDLLAGQLPEPGHLVSDEPKQLVALQNFLGLMEALDARPKVHIGYRREAWVDPRGSHVRVTFDRQVMAEPRFEAEFGTQLVQPVSPFGRQVILELKFTNFFPLWFRELVEHFDLVRAGAAKYCEGVALIGEERLGARLRIGRPGDGPGNPPAPIGHLIAV